MAVKHRMTTVKGTYLDGDTTKVAFEATLYNQVDDDVDSCVARNWKTCTLGENGEKKSTVKMSREWAKPLGLIVDADGKSTCKLNFLFMRPFGQGEEARTVSIAGEYRTGLVYYYPYEREFAKLDRTTARDEITKYQLTVETKHKKVEDCSCKHNVDSSKNAAELGWTIEDNLGLE